ncbi:hypothetical protein K503DRAFT_112192 [Rhizopogon vinicolor AM-OR11-026]|uniref:Uncharacterized protein n=1 Tax=Rhizopogon vinicolor AM-OR11-026 TaxID=1314800 RepID=A0A1B7N2K0_9AGAM|nr:hypothetical protein K503DRAFT_112192 [Rhizopogon vinicolor AM-OR11-026]
MSAQSTTPPPKKTFRSRVGTAMRRSSTSWTLPGLPNRSNTTPPPPEDPASPPLEREASTTSLRQLNTTPPPPSNPLATDTIPESPAREAAALAETSPQGPSPLAGQVITAEPASESSLQAPEERRKTNEAAGAEEPRSDIPSVVINSPEPATEAALAPVLTEEPEEMSPEPTKEPARTQNTPPPDSTAQAPVAASSLSPVTAPAPPPARVPTPPAPAAAPTQAPARTPPPAGETARAPPIAPQVSASTSGRAPTEASVPSRTPSSTPPAPPAEISRAPSTAPPTPPAGVSRAPSTAPPTPPAETQATTAPAVGYFDLVPRTTSPLDANPAEESSNVWADQVTTAVEPSSTAAPAPASDQPSTRPAVSKAVKAITRPRGSSVASSQMMAQQPSRKPSSNFQPREREIVGTTYTWSNPSSVFNQSKASLTMPSEDPFVDPRHAGPGYLLYPPQQPAALTSPVVPDVFDPRSPRDETMIAPAEPVAVPLPAMHEVMLTNSVRQVQPPSRYSSSEGENAGYFGRGEQRETE